MKKIYLRSVWAAVIVLLLTGCGDRSGSSGGNTSPPRDAGTVRLIQESLSKADKACRVIWFGEVEVDKNDVHKVKSEYTEDGEIEYYRVTDKAYQSIADLETLAKEVFSDRVYYNNYQHDIHTDGGLFIEVDGKLYFSGDNQSLEADNELIRWDPRSYHTVYESDSRRVYQVPVKTMEGQVLQNGKLAFVKEKDIWKLDTNTPVTMGPSYEEESGFSSEEGLILYIQEKEGLWRLPKRLDEYFVEVDDMYWNYSGSELYYGVGFYSLTDGKLKLEDKFFVPFGGGEPLVPEKDEKGLINLSYTSAVGKGKDDLYGYLSMRSQSYEEEIDKRINFREKKLNTFPWQFGAQGNGSFWIVPKYYGTTLIVSESSKGADGPKEYIQDAVLMISKGDTHDQIRLEYEGEAVSIKTDHDEKASFEKGIKIDFKFPEALG